jgi:hypothetical protein
MYSDDISEHPVTHTVGKNNSRLPFAGQIIVLRAAEILALLYPGNTQVEPKYRVSWCPQEIRGTGWFRFVFRSQELNDPRLFKAGTYAILNRPCSRLVLWMAEVQLVREDHESMKPPSHVKTPAQYIASLPADRAKTIAAVRAFVNKHIPRGYDECLVWGTIGWTIPLSRYPNTHNQQPITYVALASQKNYCSLYLMGAFWSASQLEELKSAFKAAGKKLDMGKCCVHFESPDDLPLEAIGKLIAGISSERWIEMYEQTRMMTKAGQAKKAKQDAASSKKAAAKRAGIKQSRTPSRPSAR